MSAVTICACCLISVLTLLLTLAASQSSGLLDEEKVKLYYYPNPVNTKERYELSDKASFDKANLDRGKPVKIMIHGADGHCFKDDVPYRIVKAYLNMKGVYEVMCLDYGPLAKLMPNLGDPIVSFRTKYESVTDMVSEKASRLILKLEAEGYITNLDKIHVIGHSLGGQVAGFIGKKIQEKTGYQKQLGRITGLDIANIFLMYSNEVSLHKQLDLSDAKFVDIVHTSPIGLKGDYGHIDFYPDGGLHQRSCLTKGPVSNVTELLIGGCSHVIVGKYWENSILQPNITACRDYSWESFQDRKSKECESENQVVFGEYVSKTARGRYFFEYPLIQP